MGARRASRAFVFLGGTSFTSLVPLLGILVFAEFQKLDQLLDFSLSRWGTTKENANHSIIGQPCPEMLFFSKNGQT